MATVDIPSILQVIQQAGHAFVSVTAPAKEPTRSDALIALTSVSAVVWTGGLIAMQLEVNRARMKALLGMEYFQFAFLMPTLALFASPLVIRCVATAIGFTALYRSMTHLHRGSRANAFARRGVVVAPDGINVASVARRLVYYGRWIIVTVIGGGLVALRPYPTTIAYVSLAMVLLGLFVLLGFLTSDD